MLDKRYDKWLNIQTSAKSKDIDIIPFFAGDGKILQHYDYIDSDELPPITNETTAYPTWRNKTNAFNAWKSHKEIFNKFLETKKDFLWLFEDDVVFTDDYDSILEECESFINNCHFDMLYFGWYSNGNLFEIGHKYIKRMIGGGGFHSVVISKDVINYLVKIEPIAPFDETCGKKVHNLSYCYAIYPSIVLQEDGYSYVEDSVLNKPERYKR